MSSLLFPRYSFIQDGSIAYPDCYPDVASCLPSSSACHLAFEFTLQLPVSELGRLEFHNYFAAVPVDFECTGSLDYTGKDGDIGEPTLHYPLFDVTTAATSSDDGITVNVTMFATCNGSIDYAGLTTANNIMSLPAGSCFKLVFVCDYIDGERFGGTQNHGLNTRTYYGCTNCLVRMPAEECYTSLLSYANDTNAFDFDYADAPEGYMNMVELPFYLRDPSMTDDQKVYTRSDGTVTKIYERKEEVYELETDQMPYLWLKALDIALSHDIVEIINKNLTSFDPLNTARYFVKKDSFEIDYNKAPLSALGKGKCKLINATPVHLINNNCG